MLSGSGWQGTDPAGAIHRLALWVGALSTAGACADLLPWEGMGVWGKGPAHSHQQRHEGEG